MLMKLRKAQTTAEYAILIGLVVGAVVAMQVYVKRGLQGRIREATDFVENSTEADVPTFTGTQYEPYYLTATTDQSQTSSGTENLLVDGATSSTSFSDSTVGRTETRGWDGASWDGADVR